MSHYEKHKDCLNFILTFLDKKNFRFKMDRADKQDDKES